MRLLAGKTVDGLRETTRRGIAQAGGPEKLQYDTRAGQAQLSRYYTEEPGRKHQLVIPADIAVEADMAAGAPIITGEMARLLGYKLVRKEEVGRSQSTLVLGDILPVKLTFQTLICDYIEAFADGHVDEQERSRIRSDAHAIVRDIFSLIEKAAGGDAAPAEDGEV